MFNRLVIFTVTLFLMLGSSTNQLTAMEIKAQTSNHYISLCCNKSITKDGLKHSREMAHTLKEQIRCPFCEVAPLEVRRAMANFPRHANYRTQCCKKVITSDGLKHSREIAKKLREAAECPFCKISPLEISQGTITAQEPVEGKPIALLSEGSSTEEHKNRFIVRFDKDITENYYYSFIAFINEVNAKYTETITIANYESFVANGKIQFITTLTKDEFQPLLTRAYNTELP